MSKGDDNKSGKTLAKVIIEKCKYNVSESARSGMNYEDSLERNLSKFFCKCYNIITGDNFVFGECEDVTFDKLKVRVADLVKGCCIDKVYYWFNIKNWQDLFPKDMKDKREFEFKRDLHSLICDLYKEMNENNKFLDKETMFEKEKVFNVRYWIYRLMEIDWHNSQKNENNKNKNDVIELDSLMDEELDELENIKRTYATELIGDRIDEIAKERKEKENREIRNYFVSGEVPEEVLNDWSPEYVELFHICIACQRNEKIDVNNMNDDTFSEWVEKCRQKYKMQEKEKDDLLYNKEENWYW